MPVDLTRPLKAAIVDHLAAATVVTALVPSTRIFAMTPPAKVAWPFIRYGSPISAPYEATCWDGSSTRVTLHAFAETKGPVAGEDRALDIAAAIIAAMDDFDPAGLAIIECDWINTNCVKDDDEADRWHSIVEFAVTAILPA